MFDYIIVGGGTAGCVLANRLSASGKHQVLLVEAGGKPTSPWVKMPVGFYKLLTHPAYNWLFDSTPEAATGHRAIAVLRGKGLGGSSLINGMLYLRGQTADYDGWAQAGCAGWGFKDVLPYFLKVEDFAGVPGTEISDTATPRSGTAPAWRGTGGPLPVCVTVERPPIGLAFINAGVAAGYEHNPDYNGASQDGFGWYQVNQRGGRRVSAEAAYLVPARRRKNLTVLTRALVTSLKLTGEGQQKRACTIVADVQGRQQEFVAGREIILAAGAVQTPQLLEVSGIGHPRILQHIGVAVRHALPEIGEHYADHFSTKMSWRVKQKGTLNEQTRGLGLARALWQYALHRRGPLTLGAGLAYGMVRTRANLHGPDVQYFFMPASYRNPQTRKLDRLPGMTVGVTQLRPQSRGTLHAKSADVRIAPDIRPNVLATDEDRRTMVAGMKIARHIINQPPMDDWRGEELTPGPDCTRDADWLAFARENGQAIYHLCGTCRMGGDAGAVVDSALRVRGIDGLRIADASIMPQIVSGNPQAAVFMIAEKAADMILQDAAGA